MQKTVQNIWKFTTKKRKRLSATKIQCSAQVKLQFNALDKSKENERKISGEKKRMVCATENYKIAYDTTNVPIEHE